MPNSQEVCCVGCAVCEMAGNDHVVHVGNSDDDGSDTETYVAERTPNDGVIRGLCQLLDQKFKDGVEIESTQADYILPNFTAGNIRYRTTLGKQVTPRIDSYSRRSS